MPEDVFLVRFGEIGIKSPPVRRRFEGILAENILRGLRARGSDGSVERTWGRLYLRAPPQPARETLAHTFGVVSFSPSREAPGDLEGLAGFAAREAGAIPAGARFAVRARRSGSTGFTSLDAARAVGARILEAHGARGLEVDLDAPDVEVVVEVRDGHAWVAFETLPGPGGLPVGSEGRASAWLAAPRDAVAAWLTMKRGCRIDALAPEGSQPLARALAAWDPGLELTELPLGAGEEGRALELALLEAHARARSGTAVVVGDAFEDALATAPLDRGIALPVLRPALALEPALLEGIAARLGVALAPGANPAAPPQGPPPDAAALRARAEELLARARSRGVAP